MEYNELIAALQRARMNAGLQGRPLSQREAAGVAQGYFQDAGQRNLQSRAISFAEQQGKDELAFARWKNRKQLEAADAANRNALISNTISTVGTFPLLKYYGYFKR
jgi:hypothetical protein